MTDYLKKNKGVLVGIGILIVIIASLVLSARKSEDGGEVLVESPLSQDIAHFFIIDTINRDDLPQVKLDQYEQSMRDAQNAVLASEDNFDLQAFLAAGTVKKAVSDFEGARDIWLYINEKRPKGSISFANLGDLYTNFLKDPEKAEEMYLIAIENDPEDANYLGGLLELYQYYLPEKLESEEKFFLDARENNQTKPQFYLVVSKYYEARENSQEARIAWEKMRDTFPEDEDVQAVASSQISRLGSE